MMAKKSDEQFSDKEAAARRDATIKRMIAMPPKPHSEMKMGKKAKKRKFKKRAAIRLVWLSSSRSPLLSFVLLVDPALSKRK